jgi:HEAT repeat protein
MGDLKNNEVTELIERLRSKDGTERERARKKLEKLGRPAVPYLIDMLSDRVQHVRWEACKALGNITDSTAATALVDALSDESVEVRWLAAEGLIALQERALVPLLQILETKFDSPYVREGAHHILHSLEMKNLLSKDSKAVLDALRSLEPKISVAWASQKALRSNAKADG